MSTMQTKEDRAACQKRFHAAHPEAQAEYRKKYRLKNLDRVRENDRLSQRRWKKKRPEWYMLADSRKRAKRLGLPNTITRADIVIPDICPVFGIPLFISSGQPTDNSPSLDRVNPKLGYVPGNIAVISMRANRIKDQGTATEHRMIADWIDGYLL